MCICCQVSSNLGRTVSLWIGGAPSPLGWELCEGSSVSPPFDEVLGQGQSPPSARLFPGLGCGSTLSLEAPWMGIVSLLSAWASPTGLFHQTGIPLRSGLSPPSARELPR